MKKVLYILGELSDDDIEWMIRVGRKVQLAPGTILIREGTQIESLYIVLEGNLSVILDSQGGIQVAQLGAGEMIGEMSFIDSRPTSATVKALIPSSALAIPRDQLSERLKDDSAFSARFHRALAVFLAYRLRDTMGQLGYSTGQKSAPSNLDELDDNLMDNVYLAGTRFDRILKRIMEAI